MAPSGFAPIDTALVFAGALWGARIHAAFGAVYLVAGLVGLVLAVWRSAQARSPAPALAWVVTGLGLWAALGTGSSPMQFRPSLVEQAGATVDPSLRPAETSGPGLPAGFLALNAGMEGATRLLIALVKEDFAINPFAVLAVMAHHASDAFDQDPALRTDVLEFIGRCYIPALGLYSQRHDGRLPAGADVDTPIGKDIVRFYQDPALGDGGRCAEDWNALLPRMRGYVEPTMGFLSRLWNWVKGKSLDDVIADRLRNARATYEPPGARVQVYGGSPIGNILNNLAGGVAKLMTSTTAAALVSMIQVGLYPMYGYILMPFYMLYPVVLALSLLQPGRMLTYLVTLLSVKLWPALWAAIDATHDRLVPYFLTLSGGDQASSLWGYPAVFEVVTAFAYLVVPVIVSVILGGVGARLGGGLGGWIRSPSGLSPIPIRPFG
jgi:hypothetical protein